MEVFDKGTASIIVVSELAKLRERIAANMYAQGAVATGGTIRSMRVIPDEDGAGAKLITDQRMPFGVLETGRRGWAYPESLKHVPSGFSGIIYDWMQAKGVHGDPVPYKTNRPHKYSAQERADRSMAYLIAKKISEQGSLLFRKGGRDNIYSNVIPEAVQAVKDRIRPYIEISTMDSIKLNTKQ